MFMALCKYADYLVEIECFRDMRKKLAISYPCVMLNVDVAINNTNDQYQVSIETHGKVFVS